MPSMHDSLTVLYPTGQLDFDWTITEDAGVTYISYWSGRLGQQPSQATIDAVTQAQIDAAKALKYRIAAKLSLAATKAEAAVDRALLLIVLDEFNLHSAKTNAILTAIDNAATLAALKTAVAAIADLPTRTVGQLRTAIQNKIDAGDADT